MCSSSSASSKVAESLTPGGADREDALEVAGDAGRLASSASRARIQLRLPCTVLISPLWATKRYGWASGHDGNVLVEKRECTSASADSTRSSCEVGEELRELRRREHALVDEACGTRGSGSSAPALVG